jgi:hypothetical protein
MIYKFAKSYDDNKFLPLENSDFVRRKKNGKNERWARRAGKFKKNT